MTDPYSNLDGFTVKIDAEQKRGDIILDRGEYNTISMAQRDQLKAVFEALDADDRVRVIVVRAVVGLPAARVSTPL